MVVGGNRPPLFGLGCADEMVEEAADSGGQGGLGNPTGDLVGNVGRVRELIILAVGDVGETGSAAGAGYLDAAAEGGPVETDGGRASVDGSLSSDDVGAGRQGLLFLSQETGANDAQARLFGYLAEDGRFRQLSGLDGAGRDLDTGVRVGKQE